VIDSPVVGESNDNPPRPVDELVAAEHNAAQYPLVAMDQFRSVISQLARAVSVVTCALDGQPYGATVSAFESLSIDPPMMLVSLNRHSTLLHTIVQARRFRVNVLSAGQQEIAERFASNLSPERFIGRGWKYDDGLPLLFDAQAWITCALGEVLEGGDHGILLGYVKDAAAQSRAPLLHCARTYGSYSTDRARFSSCGTLVARHSV
jgi:flavin reductase (DIM6/NTAB) family NADH-FMN oxidoreductase RutF